VIIAPSINGPKTDNQSRIITASIKKPIHNVKDVLAHSSLADQRNCFSSSLEENGGAYRDRTDDLMLAKQPLSQLS
jgi:hypothetical protein